MLIVSHYLLDKIDATFPEHMVVRVNVAWLETNDELEKVLGKLKHDIYLDYPQGRTKPPVPQINLEDAIAVAHQFPRVKYFAVSNVEEPEGIFDIKKRLPGHIEMIPKIETELGVRNLENIALKTGIRSIMFDKEDLYIDVNRDSGKFDELVGLARNTCKKLGVDILELHGVVFLPFKHTS